MLQPIYDVKTINICQNGNGDLPEQRNKRAGGNLVDVNRLFLGYETAFWIWRKAGPQAFLALAPTRVRSLAGGTPSAEKIQVFRSEHPDLYLDKVDVLVQYGGQRAISHVKNHVRSLPFPDRSFYRLDEGLYVASPELCFLQLASKLSEPKAVKLALEMCGSYAIDVHDEEMGFCKRPPLTSAAKLKAYAKRLYKQNGGAKALHCLRYVVDNSASPRETAVCMLFCLPPRFGGYGLALPEMNRRIELSAREQITVGSRYFNCDLFWADRRVAVEYDSAQYHTAREKQERDAIRRNMLEHKGVRVITATRQQVSEAGQFDKLASQVARAVGKRLRAPKQEHIAERSELRRVLFDWDVLPPVSDADNA